jgi:hypothetical protein
MVRSTTLLMAFLLTAAIPIGAQPTPAEPPRVDPTLLRTGVDSMHIILIRNGERMPIGMLWDEIQPTEYAGAPALRRVYRTVNHAFGPRSSLVCRT